MERTFSKQISDPVHGTIELTPLEVRIINTRSFQRLTRIGQLGLVHLVFPGAQYSRFSHSLGVCHVTGRILDSINDTPGFVELNAREWQRYRLAGLLHDVGHYPFSHTLENVLEDTYDEEHQGPYADDDEPSADGKKQYMEHEAVGACILKHDPEIRKILEEFGYEEEVAPIFQRIEPDTDKGEISEDEAGKGKERSPDDNPGIEYADVVSSGLDADRLDYLMRSSRFSGVPYGGIDLDYLISQFQVDPDERVCLTNKARLTADHFLLSRWFEYQQMIYHHTVQGASSALQDVLQEALERDYLPSCNRENVIELVSEGGWPDYDDNRALNAIRRLRNDTSDNEIADKCRAVLERRLPKVVYEEKAFQKIQTPTSDDSQNPAPLIKTLEEKIGDAVDLELYPISQTNKLPFTKMEAGEGLSPAASTSGDHDVRIAEEIKEQDEFENPSEEHLADLIADDDDAVISLLNNQQRHVWRLYVLFGTDSDGNFPDEATMKEARKKIDEVIHDVTEDWNNK